MEKLFSDKSNASAAKQDGNDDDDDNEKQNEEDNSDEEKLDDLPKLDFKRILKNDKRNKTLELPFTNT